MEKLTSSVDPSNLLSFPGIMKEILRFHDINFNVCAPAIVKEVYYDSRMVLVTPLNNEMYSTSEGIKGEPARDVLLQLWQQQHGGFIFDFPIFVGDTGWMIASDRDTSRARGANSGLVMRDSNPNAGPQDLNTLEMHQFCHGFFIPDHWGHIRQDANVGGDKLIIGNLDKDGWIQSYLALDKDGKWTVKGEGLCNLKLTGTDGKSLESSKFRFVSEDDSNVTVRLVEKKKKSSNGKNDEVEKEIRIGVYYV